MPLSLVQVFSVCQKIWHYTVLHSFPKTTVMTDLKWWEYRSKHDYSNVDKFKDHISSSSKVSSSKVRIGRLLSLCLVKNTNSCYSTKS